MATQTAESGFATLAEWASRRDPNGGISSIVNVLSQRNDILQDMLWAEGNLPTGHLITQSATSLPSGTWRQFNQGRAKVSTQTEQFTEACGMLGAESSVDIALAKLNGDPAGFRRSRDQLIMEGLNQQFAGTVFYGDSSVDPEKPHGLSPRYYSTTLGDAASYVLASSSPASTSHSIWLINWAPGRLYGIFPKGSMAGLEVQDKGEQRVLDSSGNSFYAYVTNFEWHCGIAVEDYRYAVRYQWDPTDTECADDDRGIYLAMQEMLGTIYDTSGNLRFYMNRTSKKKLDAQLASNDVNPLTQWQNGQDGRMVPAFSGVPIRICDQLIGETTYVA